MFYTDHPTNRIRAVSNSLPLLFQLHWFVLGWRFFEELNSERLHLSSPERQRTEENRCLVFPSSIKHEIWKDQVIDVQRRQMFKKAWCTTVQSCCFANLNLLLFCLPRCCRQCWSSLARAKYNCGGQDETTDQPPYQSSLIWVGGYICCKEVANLGLNSGYAFRRLPQIRWSQG